MMNRNRKLAPLGGFVALRSSGARPSGIHRDFHLQGQVVARDVRARCCEIKCVAMSGMYSLKFQLLNLQMSPRSSASLRNGWLAGNVRSSSLLNVAARFF